MKLLFRRLFLAVTICCAQALLSSCCMYGVIGERTVEWEAVHGDANKIKASCETEVEQRKKQHPESASSSDLDACYEKNGLRRVERTVTRCRTMMPLF